jgi:hypothetical protein
VSPREELLAAAVDAAYDARGTPKSRAAVEQVIRVWRQWPLIEYAHALETATRLEAQQEAELHAWYQHILPSRRRVADAA